MFLIHNYIFLYFFFWFLWEKVKTLTKKIVNQCINYTGILVNWNLYKTETKRINSGEKSHIKKTSKQAKKAKAQNKNTEKETKNKRGEEKNEANNIPVQCLVLCKLWESNCSLAWERATADPLGRWNPLASRQTPVEWQSRHSQMCGSAQYKQKEHMHLMARTHTHKYTPTSTHIH